MNGTAPSAGGQTQLQPSETTNPTLSWDQLIAPSLIATSIGRQDRGTLLQTSQWHGDTAALVSGMTFDDLSGVEVNVNAFGNWDVSQLSPSAPMDADGLPTAPISHPSPAQGSPLSASVASISGKESASAASVTSSTHDCEARAISLLHSMQHGEMHHGATSCSSDPVHYTNLNLAPSFDRVLSVNKAVLDGWSQLMKCSCALCPHIILLHVSILSKMIFWYRIAAAEDSPTPGHVERSKRGPSNGSTPQDPPTVNQFSVLPITIQVGTLSLDAEDQVNLRRTLLLRELRRAEQAIEELMKVDRSALEEVEDGVVHRSVQWSLGGIARVKEELQDVIQKVKQIR